jgi:hypothetical protein
MDVSKASYITFILKKKIKASQIGHTQKNKKNIIKTVEAA